MSSKAFRICDGLGAQRVKNIVLDEQPEIVLRPMGIQDESILFSWQCEPGNRKYSGVDQTPNIDEHRAWYKKSLSDNSRRMWLLIFEGRKCGYVRLDAHHKSEEVSVLISQKYRKLGLAHGAISKLKELCLFGVLNAQVSPDNRASVSLFKKLDFKKKSSNLIIIGDFKNEIKKTKEMNKILKKFEANNSLIILDKNSKEKVFKSLRNLPNVKTTDINHFSAFDIIKFKKVIFTETSVKELEKRYE